jgi:Fur family transcriptional regulator, peroxide stress response regulator
MELRLIEEQRHPGYASRRLDEFVRRCRESGLAVTPQRLAIIRALMSSAEHPRADQICAIVRRRHPHISLATVHRTLETLCDIGEARKVTMLHDSARYDANLEPHHHVICVRCRRVRDVEVSGLDDLMERREGLGEFAMLGCALEILALCRSCAAKQARAGKRSKSASSR